MKRVQQSYSFNPQMTSAPPVHLTGAAGHAEAGFTGKGRLPVCRPPDVAEAHRAGHQHAAARHSACPGHPVAVARLHQVSCILFGAKAWFTLQVSRLAPICEPKHCNFLTINHT